MANRDHARTRVFRPDLVFNGVKVFSATLFADRGRLGDRITDWIAADPRVTITEMVVTQSSDDEYHCLAITVFFREQGIPSQ